jgi:hypothetical protein
MPGCQNPVIEGMRLCPKHCALQANRWCGVYGYSVTEQIGVSGVKHLSGRQIIENAMLMLLFERSEAGPFMPEREGWLDNESRMAYEFLRQHLQRYQCL